MSLPPRYINLQNGTTGMPDALAPYGVEPSPATPAGAHSAGVLLFDPETDTSPYAAKHKKPKTPKPAPGEKPSVTASARAAATKAAERAQRNAPAQRVRPNAGPYRGPQEPEASAQPAPSVPSVDQAGQPSAATPSAEHRNARRIAGHRHSDTAPASPTPQRGPLRIVSNDPNEIRHYAEAQRRSESVSAARARTVQATPTVQQPSAPDELETAAITFATSTMPAVSTVVPDPAEPPAPTPVPMADRLATARNALRAHLMVEHVWRVAMVWVTALACVLVTITMLYFPSQELYRAVRENERLAQELDLNLARNEQMQTRVASLQTAEGIQDEATRAYGLVMPGEHAVTVVGAPYEPPATAIPAQIPRGSGENTHSWATDLLDNVFGVVGTSASVATSTDVATLSETPADTDADIVAQGDA